MARTAAKGERRPADHLPVARVCVDVGLAHLDRPFDYLVPQDLTDQANPGCRVRVRFAGKLIDGWLLDRVAASDHGGKLAYLERVVAAEPALSPPVLALARAVAERYAGNLADVLRLAVPARHARAEKAAPPAPPPAGEPPASEPPAAGVPAAPPAVEPKARTVPDSAREAEQRGATTTPPAPVAGSSDERPHQQHDAWAAYQNGPAFLRALAEGRSPRAVWAPLPGEDWAARLAEVIAAAADRGVLAVVPDARDLARLDAACASALGPGRHVCLSAALGPQQRYAQFLAALRGQVRVVLGTRAAMFAPVTQLGLVILWDDGDGLHAEPRAPYPHAREVLLTRAQLQDCGVLIGSFSRTAEAQLLLETQWAKEIAPDRATVRDRAPRVLALGAEPQLARDPAAATARLPSIAWQAAGAALRAGLPVLVQVPRRGYLPSVSCQDCRTPARCTHCKGPLELREARGGAVCRWCGRNDVAYACPHCGGRRLRASVVGARRTAEELGRAFAGVPVRTSGRDEIIDQVPAEAAVVVATPGAEPTADGGFGAVLLLDTWALLSRTDLRAAEEALRRWSVAAALARPASEGGQVIVVADAALAPVQALVRWDQGWFAARELADRRELGFPPAARFASVTGTAEAVNDLLMHVPLPAGGDLLGPVPAGDGQERMLVRVRRSQALALAKALHEAAAGRSARKATHPVRIQLDPAELW